MSEASALCALHPETPAAFVCARCGTFGCEACRPTRDATFCGACTAPVPTVLLGKLDSVSLLRDSLPRILRNLPVLMILTVAWVVTGSALSIGLLTWLSNAPSETNRGWIFLTSAPPAITNVFIYAGIVLWMGEHFRGRRERSLLAALLVGPASTPRLILPWMAYAAVLLVALFLELSMVSLLFPIWVLALPGVVLDRLGALAALGRFFALTKGHRLSLLTLFLLYFFARTLFQRAILSVPFDPSAPSALAQLTRLMAPWINAVFSIILVTALTLFYLRRTRDAGPA